MESGYKVVDGQSIVMLFSRNYDDPLQTVTHEFSYTPYFYAPASESYKNHPLIISKDSNVILDAKGREVVKINVTLPYEVSKVREIYSWTDESDVLFDKRFLVDHKIKYAYEVIDDIPSPVEVEHVIDPLILYFDIENRAPEGNFPNPQDALYPIISIQYGTNYDDKITILTYGVGNSNDPCQIQFNTEQELLTAFCLIIEQINPDIITAWNSNQFDIPYIINRAEKLHVTLKGLSRYGECKLSFDSFTGKFRFKIPGRASLDEMEAFKKYNIGKGQRESNGLKSVISDKELLKDAAFSYTDIAPIIDKVLEDHRYKEFIDYCKNDVIALKVIDKTLKLFNYFESIRFIAGNKINDGTFNSLIIEMFFMHEGIKPLPRKTYGSNSQDKFKGALVVEPVMGVHEWVQTVDLNALYPHILVGFNVSPDIDGIVPKSTRKLIDLREVYREQKKQGIIGASAKDSAAKSLVNSVYGIMGAESSRLYDREKASFITKTGREINMYIQKLCKERGKSIIYGDTDSVFLSRVLSGSEAIEIEEWLNDELKKWSIEMNSTVIFKLKAEKLFRRLLFKSKANDKNTPGKKKYAGHLIWEEGSDCDTFKSMGLEIKRSDNSNITKECLKYFLETLLIEGNTKKATEYVKSKYIDIKKGRCPIIEISIPKEIRKLNYDSKNSWIDGRNYAREKFNYIIQEGEKPRLLYLKHNEVICIDDGFNTSLIQNDIDWETMADKTIKSKLESYFWAIGLDWNTAIKGQKTFDDW